MPDYFGQFEIVAQTKNFIVTCVDDAEARMRARNVATVCEADLARLNDLFSTNFDAGNTSPHGIWVNVLQDLPSATANGWNYGYETEASSRIVLQRAFVPPLPLPPPPDPPAVKPANVNSAVLEFPRFVFVAELAEILMEFTGYGWNRRDSMGEGLSILLATLLHPIGYYDASQGPRINQWLNGGGGPPVNPSRAAVFVNTTEDTDLNVYSYGCAILFMNYLVYQLGHPLTEVIRFVGSSLAESYARLTGNSAASAFGTFNALLQNHIGNEKNNKMLRDNIFPLLDPNLRSVAISLGDPIDKGHFTDSDAVAFELRASMIACTPGKYDFFRQHQQVEQVVYARAMGMASAEFRWSIEGVDVSVRGSWTNITINKAVWVKNPDGKTQTVASALTFQYAIGDSWNASALYLKTLTTGGNFLLNVLAAAREASVKDAEVSATREVGLFTVEWLPGVGIKNSWKTCNPQYARLDKTIWRLTTQLGDLKNRPGPPSERSLVKIADAVHQLDVAVGQYAKAGHMTMAEVWNQIGRAGGLRSVDAPAPELDLARLSFPQAKQSVKQTEE